MKRVGVGVLFVLMGAGGMVGDVAARSRQVMIHVYPSFCTPVRCTVRGRLLRQSRWLAPKKKEGRFRKLMRGVRRFLTEDREIRHHPVTVELAGVKKRVFSDGEGVFRAFFGWPPARSPLIRRRQATSSPTTSPSRPRPLPCPASAPTSRRSTSKTSKLQVSKGPNVWRGARRRGVLSVRVRLDEMAGHSLRATPAKGLVVFPSRQAGLSVISDLDDTLIVTNVTKKTKMLLGVLFKSYKEVKVVPGALSFLRALLRSPCGQGGGTLHYVTGSPVNLFGRINGLFRLRNFPAGSLSMKKLGGPNKDSLTDQLRYKLSKIRPILRAYPRRRFVLLGDSGEKDPEIYQQIRREFPRQILWIYLRNVTGAASTHPRFRQTTLFSSYKEALRHARGQKWVR